MSDIISYIRPRKAKQICYHIGLYLRKHLTKESRPTWFTIRTYSQEIAYPDGNIIRTTIFVITFFYNHILTDTYSQKMFDMIFIMEIIKKYLPITISTSMVDGAREEMLETLLMYDYSLTATLKKETYEFDNIC